MALSQSKLQQGLLQAFSSPGGAVGGARALAQAYSKYALDANSCAAGTILPAVLVPKTAGLTQSLIAAFSSGLAPATQNLIATALSLFWLGVPFTAAIPGAVTAAIPGSLAIALLSISGVPSSSVVSSKLWATALHTWTTTSVIATHTGIGACVSPIF